MKSRALTYKPEIEDIINKCDTCHVSMVDKDNMPYVLPMNFGYREEVIYLHSAPQGKKIDIIKNNPNVCIAFSADHHLRWQHEKVACSYSMKYRSVLAQGKIEFITDIDKKIEALNIIMGNYTDKKFSYNDPAVREVSVYKVKADIMEGRAYGY